MEKRNTNDLFCDNEVICNEIITFLTDNLLGKELKSDLICRYNDMRSNYDYINTEWQFTTKHKRFAPLQTSTSIAVPICHDKYQGVLDGCSAIGVDLPTWYNMGTGKRIMFIAQDPLRDKYWYGGGKNSEHICKDIILSSPFGTHDKMHRESRFGRLYFSIFQDFINQDYGIYLTDINKFYVGIKSKGFRGAQLKKEYQDMLRKEIEIIKPDLIVTFGGISTCFFSQGESWQWFEVFDSKEFNKPILPMIHPSPTARGTGALKELLNGINKDENLINKYIEKIKETLTKC